MGIMVGVPKCPLLRGSIVAMATSQVLEMRSGVIGPHGNAITLFNGWVSPFNGINIANTQRDPLPNQIEVCCADSAFPLPV